jgi:hypothetical protein
VKWTQRPPDEAGFYWATLHFNLVETVVHVTRNPKGLSIWAPGVAEKIEPDDVCLWSDGPLLPPIFKATEQDEQFRLAVEEFNQQMTLEQKRYIEEMTKTASTTATRLLLRL